MSTTQKREKHEKSNCNCFNTILEQVHQHCSSLAILWGYVEKLLMLAKSERSDA